MLPQDPNSPLNGPSSADQTVPSATGPYPVPTGPPIENQGESSRLRVPSDGPENLDGEPRKEKAREGLAIGAAVLLGALLVLGGLLGFQRWRSSTDDSALGRVQTESSNEAEGAESGGDQVQEDETNETDSTGNEQDGSATVDPDLGDDSDPEAGSNPDLAKPKIVPSECPAATVPEICNAVRFVEEETGRNFKEFPEVELLEDGPFDAELLKDFEQYEVDLNEDEIALKAMGLLDVELSLYDTYLSLLELGVVGFYNPETGQLVVRGGELNLYAQSVLVHELVHAHDDQWYNLDRDDFENDDAEYGFGALVEGNASRIENAWVAGLSAEDAAAVEAGAFDALSPQDFAKLLALPPVLIQLQASPYEDGEAFVAFRADVGGEAVLEGLYADPPQSSEQVLHPADTYQPILTVDPPPSDGTVTSSGTVGELLLSFWLGDEAAAGWGGDTFVTWSDGPTTCMNADIATDTTEDLEQLEAAAARWASVPTTGTGARKSEIIDTAERSVLRITGCYRT